MLFPEITITNHCHIGGDETRSRLEVGDFVSFYIFVYNECPTKYNVGGALSTKPGTITSWQINNFKSLKYRSWFMKEHGSKADHYGADRGMPTN